MRRSLIALAGLLLVGPSVAVPATSFAEPSRALGGAQVACRYVESVANTVLDSSTTVCTTVPGKDGVPCLVVALNKPAFGEVRQTAWILTVAVAVGKFLNDHPELALGHVLLTDPELGADGAAYWIRAAPLKRLQRRVRSDQLDVDGLDAAITTAWRRGPLLRAPAR